MRYAAGTFEEAKIVPLQKLTIMEAITGVSWPDPRAFWQAGYRALMSTGRAALRYPHYQTAEDTTSKVDYLRLSQVTQALFKAIDHLAFEA